MRSGKIENTPEEQVFKKIWKKFEKLTQFHPETETELNEAIDYY